MKNEKITFILPAWAVLYIVNNDTDTITDDELTAVNSFLAKNGLVGCPMSPGEQSFFSWRNDVDNLGGDCYECTFLVPAKDTKRKTMDCFEIWSNYGYGPEFTTAAENYQEAKRLLAEYRGNQPQYPHWIKKERIKNPDYIPTPFEQIICPVNSTYGAPMGRESVLRPGDGKTHERVFDRRVPLDSGGYDKGGAYWGHGKELRVRYTKSLSLIHFYRVGE